jgi:rhamnosyltransferase
VQNSDDILTVIVLYHLNLQDAPAFKSLTAARRPNNVKGELFIYDNSPDRQVIAPTELWNVHYVHNPSNPGVSKAYNEASVHAMSLGMKWMLLADQDTYFPFDIFDRYHLACAEHHGGLFAPILVDDGGIVSPFTQRFGRGTRLKIHPVGKMNLNDACAINSGLLVSLDLFRKAGGYDERVRLDFSDIHFFQKLKPFTEHFVVLNVVCRHTLSSSPETKLKDALNRFIIYLEGSRITGRAFGNALLYECNAILRAIRLSWQYRSLRFFGTLFSRAA